MRRTTFFVRYSNCAGLLCQNNNSLCLIEPALIHKQEKSHPHMFCRALEVGSGSGYIICSLALALNNQHIRGNRLLLATDLNPSAAVATHETLAAHGMKHSADVIVTDLDAALQPRLHGAVDLLVFNPPYVPTPDEEVQRGGIAAAWAGGYRGRRVLDRLLPSIPLLLSDRGQAFVIALPDNDPQEVLKLMADVGLQGKVVAQRSADEERLLVLQFWREMNE
jgi:release factor glutamine methyltransferase